MNKLVSAKFLVLILSLACASKPYASCSSLLSIGKKDSGFPKDTKCVSGAAERTKNPKYTKKFGSTFCTAEAAKAWDIDPVLLKITQSANFKTDQNLLKEIGQQMKAEQFAVPADLLRALNLEANTMAIYEIRRSTQNQSVDADSKFLSAVKSYIEANNLQKSAGFQNVYMLACSETSGSDAKSAKIAARGIDGIIESLIRDAVGNLTDAQLAAAAGSFLSDCENQFAAVLKLMQRNPSYANKDLKITTELCRDILKEPVK